MSLDVILVLLCMAGVIGIYFSQNKMGHSRKYMWYRFVNWFVLGMTYAFLYMARYNLSVSKNAFGDMMSKEDFGLIFGIGTFVYGCSFLLTGPFVDRFGGKRGMLVGASGSALANILMGCLTYYFMHGGRGVNLTVSMSILYAMNMFFQSFGAVSIIKVKAYWFHVRERGVFGAIFGTLISFGVYFAFDWGQRIADAVKVTYVGKLSWMQSFIRTALAIDAGTTDGYWHLFFIPAGILVVWVLLDTIFLKDSPEDAGFDPFDPHDASSDEVDEQPFSMLGILKRIFTNPVLLTCALVDFTSGVLRNGIMQWYFVFAKEVPQIGAEFFKDNWGLLLCMTGVLGGFTGGLISDRFFNSRRGPPASILSGVMMVFAIIMSVYIMTSPMIVGLCATAIVFAVIGVHSLMSGTAAADFGGRKATATASGIVDGCVYIGSGIQSVSLGYLTTRDWHYWPLFLIPFAFIGMVAAWRIWHKLPTATERYLRTVERIDVTVVKTTKRVVVTE